LQEASFVIPLRPLPSDSSMHWRRTDVPGREAARIQATSSGWRLTGQLDAEEAGTSARLEYSISCDDRWRTLAAVIMGEVNERPVQFAISADGQGNWKVNGAPQPALGGALDIDLGFTPATNLLPIRRLNLRVGETASVRTAWLRFPELRLEALEQAYTREADRVFVYEALVDGEPFRARLETDEYGRVLRYEGLWEAEDAEALNSTR
jgi:hypothetical protein